MLTAGVDVGSLTAEAVAVDGDRVVAAAIRPARPDPVDSARGVLQALTEEGLDLPRLRFTLATGYGRERVQARGLAQDNVSEISCHGYGVHCQAPSVRTIVDIGGQDAKVIKVDARGDLDHFAMNDKCAAGTGHFLELMARTLGVPLDRLGPLALGARRPLRMTSRCSIFVETEVMHFLQRGHAATDVAAGICRAMAERVAALSRRVSPEPALAMTGGVAKNAAVRRELEERLGHAMVTLRLDPQLAGAYGAAMLAQRRAGGRP